VLKRFLVAAAVAVGAASSAYALDRTTLKVAIPNQIFNLDPIKAVVVQDRFILPLIYEFLVSADSTGEIKNVLVQNWQFDSKKHLLTFKLAPGHRFSDGSEVTVKDVIDSFRRLCDTNNKASGDMFGLKGCGSSGTEKLRVRYLDDKTVEIATSVDASTLLYQLAYGRGAVTKEDKRGKLIGSGPYMIESNTPTRLLLTKNPHYSSKKLPASVFQKIEFQFVPVQEVESRIGRGEFHLASMYLSSNVSERISEEYAVHRHAPFITQSLVLNPKGPFADRALRQAFFAEIYNEADFSKCFGGILKAYGLIPEGIGGSIANRAPEKIKNSAAPGAQSGKPVPIEFLRHSGRKNQCEEDLVVAAGRKFNLAISFRHMDSYETLFPKYSDPKTQGYVELMAFISRDPSLLLRRFLPGSREQIYFYTSPLYEKLLDEAWQKPSLSEKFEFFRKINGDILDRASVIPLYYVGHTRIMHKCLVASPSEAITYNPNSFLFLEQVQFTEQCPEGAVP
jgi:ABC-type oligopeptide transport system substrate-binding subunit